MGGVGKNLFGHQAATLTRGEKVKEKTDAQIAITDALYELPDNSDLELEDGLLEILYMDIPELFAEFIRSIDPLNLQDMHNDIRANRWGIKKITDVNDAEDFMTIFQTFYQLDGRLPLSNSL